MNHSTYYPLKKFNTFGIDVLAKEAIFIKKSEDLVNRLPIDEVLILGGGSNILFTKNVDIPIWINELKGIRITEESDDYVEIAVASGENWHELVLWCIENDFGGIENMSLIPGSVGAAPMQNIGAYGAEIKDVLTYVSFVNLNTGELKRLENADCKFGYRDSIFKNELRNKVFITEVGFRLSKNNHQIRIDYGDIQRVLAEKTMNTPTIRDVSNAVIEIRSSKLPNPKEIGNAGSFFKNPVISKAQFDQLKITFPEMVGYPMDEQNVKVAAGWLIEKAGWKGYREQDFGVHEKQALVLVNYGNSKGTDIYQLAQKIIQDVASKFQINLQMEVNVF